MRARLAFLAVLAVAGLIAVLGVTAIPALGAGHEAEVRITAQRLADDRIEFALQQREADGGWSERLLPRGRFFPAAATVGRWLSSTPLTVRVPGADDDAEGTEVRITAQRLADGRTEFALQEREADGGWGERLLPRGTVLPGHGDGRALAVEHAADGEPAGAAGIAGHGRRRERGVGPAALVACTTPPSWRCASTDGGWSDRPLQRWCGSSATATVVALAVEHAVDGEPAGVGGAAGDERQRGVGPGGAGRPLQRNRRRKLGHQHELGE